jgi:N-acetylmuramoyl-L-alanine amidase
MGGSESARREAVAMSRAYSRATGVPIWNGGAFDDRNSRFGRIGMVRDTMPFALLIEAGFVTNELDVLVDVKKSAKGICSYFFESNLLT